MRIGILGIGNIARRVLAVTAQGLEKILPETKCSVVSDVLAVPMYAYDRGRRQYKSSLILNDVRTYGIEQRDFDRILGLIDADVYGLGLNYVFGEAYAPGIAGLVSLTRLRPEFYGEAANEALFMQRLIKESVHEMGHTLGLLHCPLNFCVMHFSNSIFEVDKKQSLFCDQCYLNASLAITDIGN